MANVYPVMTGFYEQYGLSRIFATREAAETYVKNEMDKHAGFDAGKREYYEIMEVPVDNG